MVPPTIGSWAAYVGGDEGANLMWFAYAQIKGYRNLLQDKKTNLWRHIVEGNWEDRGEYFEGGSVVLRSHNFRILAHRKCLGGVRRTPSRGHDLKVRVCGQHDFRNRRPARVDRRDPQCHLVAPAAERGTQELPQGGHV